MVAESHRQVSSFSKLTLELGPGEHTTVGVGRPELQNWERGASLERRFAISCYCDVKKE